MRPEQKKAVKVTSEYFKKSNKSKNRTPKFLWNAKMRFGKTFTTYQLANVMGWNKVLVLTYVPAVENEWKSILEKHVDFEGWKFFSNKNNVDGLDQHEKICYFPHYRIF